MQTQYGAFDFAFNGTMSQAQIDQLLTLDFIREGKNLAVIGHIATGKTVTIDEVRRAARAIGLTERYIWDRPMSMYGAEFEDPAILTADILVIDEFNHWLFHETTFATHLLALRGMLGKSTLVTMLDSVFERFGNSLIKDCPRGHNDRRLHYLAAEHRLVTPEQLNQLEMPDGELTLVETIKALGIDLAPPAGSSLDKVHTTDKWLHIYTGTKSYRDVLLARRAA